MQAFLVSFEKGGCHKVQYYSTEDLLRTVPALINPSNSTLIIVMAPTSKLTTNFKMFELAVELAQKIPNGKVTIVQNCGPRIDLAASMQAKGAMELCDTKLLLCRLTMLPLALFT
jgi:hypothetical protein